jgi:hypothetical protein
MCRTDELIIVDPNGARHASEPRDDGCDSAIYGSICRVFVRVIAEVPGKVVT